MVLLNHKQVKYIHDNKPLTDWYNESFERKYLVGFVHIGMVKDGFKMYLNFYTYFNMPNEFKQLAQ